MEPKVQQVILNTLGVTDEEARRIGLRLKEKRIQNNSDTIVKIANRLKLNSSYIELIENGDWHALPQSANGRGFVRLYAKELNVELPEFEKFQDTHKSLVAPKMQTNLDKLVECARAKRLVQMSAFQIAMIRILLALRKALNSKHLDSNHDTEKNQQNISIYGKHKKKLIWLGSVGIFVIGTTFMFYMLNKHDFINNLLNSEMTDQFDDEEDEKLSKNMILDTSQVTRKTEPKELSSQTTAHVNQVQTEQQPEKIMTRDVSEELPQNMKIDILSPVVVFIEADGKEVLNGLAKPGSINLTFRKKAILIINDSSKVKLSYAGWEHEALSLGTRKRTIVLNAKRFKDDKSEYIQ